MSKTLGSERHKALISLIIEKRKAAGLKQSEVADAFGEHQSWVARLESGQRRVDVIEYLALSDLLKFSAVNELRQLMKIPS